MPKLTEFEEEYYRLEGKYEPMDPDKFYGDMPNMDDKSYVEDVQNTP